MERIISSARGIYPHTPRYPAGVDIRQAQEYF
jgi:hypothetical protein